MKQNSVLISTAFSNSVFLKHSSKNKDIVILSHEQVEFHMYGISLNSESLQDSFFVFVQTFLVTEKHTNRNNAAAVEMQPCKIKRKL